MAQNLKKTLFWVCLLLAGEARHMVQAAQPSTIYVYDMDQGLGNKRAMMASLAGVVARTSAEVALGYQNSQFDGDPDFWVDEYIAQNPGTNKVWQGSVEWFIDQYKNDLAGYVVYDSATINEATSVTGALGAVMVDQSLLAGSVGTALSNAGLTQLEDVRGRDSSWVYSNYGSMFNKDLIFRQQPTFDYQLRSLAVKEVGFVFNETGALRDTYLAGQNDHSLVYGWGFNNSESEFFGSASQNNLMGVPADHLQSAGPHSAWDAQVPSQAAHTPANTPTQSGKHYVAFVMSDGDNVQWLTNDFSRSTRWFGSPHRGNFDFSFDLSPALLSTNPVALKYFYEQAAGDASKTFFVTAGGEGLNYPSQVPDVSGFMDTTIPAMQAVDHNVISVLDDSYTHSSLNQMVERDEVMGLMLKTGAAYAGAGGSIHWHQGKPIVSVKHTLWDGFDTPNSILSSLNNAPTDPFNDQGSYTIVNVHPWSTSTAGGGIGDPMSNVNQIVQNLDADVEVVTLEELLVHLRNNFGDPVDPTIRRNFVINGDFEALDSSDPNAPADWNFGAGTSYITGDDSDGSGSHAVSISQMNTDWRSEDFDATVGENLTFVFDIKFSDSVPDGSGLRGDARFFTAAEESGGTFVGESTVFVNSTSYAADEWHTITLEGVVVPAGVTVGDVRFSTFFGPFAGGEIFIDNVRLLEELIPGDFNGDGRVDGEDFRLWQLDRSIGPLSDWEANYGVGAPLSGTSAAVPEPTTCTLALAALCLLGRRRSH